MIRIKAVDEQNILDVCKLKAKQDDISTVENYSFCNVLSVVEANYHSEMYPKAIYNNNVLIGFFMYKRTESQADTAIIYRFMVDDRFQRKGLEEKALELGANHIELSAQIQAKDFYKKLGYTEIGEIYKEEFCPHIKMFKDLK